MKALMNTDSKAIIQLIVIAMSIKHGFMSVCYRF